MTGSDCRQMSIDQEWSLTRTNACHIAVQNDEMGEMRDTMMEIALKVDIILWATAPIYLAILGLVIKKIWGKTNGEKNE